MFEQLDVLPHSTEWERKTFSCVSRSKPNRWYKFICIKMRGLVCTSEVLIRFIKRHQHQEWWTPQLDTWPSLTNSASCISQFCQHHFLFIPTPWLSGVNKHHLLGMLKLYLVSYFLPLLFCCLRDAVHALNGKHVFIKRVFLFTLNAFMYLNS